LEEGADVAREVVVGSLDLGVGEAGPAEFEVGEVVGAVAVEVEELVGDGVGAADDEVDGVGAEVFGI
jgi:hypothetical protein